MSSPDLEAALTEALRDDWHPVVVVADADGNVPFFEAYPGRVDLLVQLPPTDGSSA